MSFHIEPVDERAKIIRRFNNPKPHLKKMASGLWQCYCQGLVEFGTTPVDAYRALRRKQFDRQWPRPIYDPLLNVFPREQGHPL